MQNGIGCLLGIWSQKHSHTTENLNFLWTPAGFWFLKQHLLATALYFKDIPPFNYATILDPNQFLLNEHFVSSSNYNF